MSLSALKGKPQLYAGHHNCRCPFNMKSLSGETVMCQRGAHPGDEACSLMEEAGDVLVHVVKDLDGHVREVLPVEARDDGGRIQDVGDASLLQAIQIARRPYGPCIRQLVPVSSQLIVTRVPDLS